MNRGLLPLLGLLAAGGQMTLTAPALAQKFDVDIQPRSAQFGFGAPVVHYLRVAPQANGMPQGRLCLRLSIKNNDTKNALQLSAVKIAVGTSQKVVPVSSTSSTEPVPSILPGKTGIWWNQGPTPTAPGSTTFNPSDCLLFPLPAPNTGTLTLSFAGIAAPPIIFGLKAHDGSVYAFPGMHSDRRPGEFWKANSITHLTGAEGSQLFAYDMAVVGFDSASNTWSECLPGVVCNPSLNPGIQNKDYRIWGTKVHAMADGKVVEFMDNVATNTTVGQINPGICGVQGAGNHFYIDHGGETVLYAHMQPGTVNTSLKTVGALVKKGDVLGLAGNAGTASNPHLHIHAMIGQLAIAPGKNADGLDQTCLREVAPLLLRPLPFSGAEALDLTALNHSTFAGPWVKLDGKGPPPVGNGSAICYGSAGPPPANIATIPGKLNKLDDAIQLIVKQEELFQEGKRKSPPTGDVDQLRSQIPPLLKQLSDFNRTRCPADWLCPKLCKWAACTWSGVGNRC